MAMRIENNIPVYHIPVQQHNSGQGQTRPARSQHDPGIVVDISPEGWAAYARKKAEASGGIKQGSVAALNPEECKTCGGRKYKDVSSDPSVSFQTPTHVSPGEAAAVVASHESEHVANEQVKAEREGREIISQTVILRTSICPECKRVYISGGTTYTISTKAGE